MLKNIKAVIFDLDGVITDTSVLHENAWRKMAQEENIPFDDEIADQLRGVSREKSLELILENAHNKHNFQKNYTQEQFKELMDRKNNYYIESLSFISPKDLLPGVNDLLNYLKRWGYKIAIGSSSKNARPVIKNLQIEDRLDAIVDGTEITHSKPHPEIFQKAAYKVNIPYEQCAVVEDAASGVESANAAGMMSIGIGPEKRFNQNKNQIPDFRFDNMEELNNKIGKK